jgi:hypothetical protein
MVAIVHHIIRGFGNLPGYGHHPGARVFLLLVALGTLGAGWLGGAAIVSVFGPMLCYGAYARSREFDQRH